MEGWVNGWMERMRDLLQVTQVLTARSGHQRIHKSWLERGKKSGWRGLCEQSLGAGNHHSTEETLVSHVSPVTCSARSYEVGDPDGGSPRVLWGRARRLHSKQVPTAQRIRLEQAQPGGRTSEGLVWPYLVFKELGGFSLALLPTRWSEATHSC